MAKTAAKKTAAKKTAKKKVAVKNTVTKKTAAKKEGAKKVASKKAATKKEEPKAPRVIEPKDPTQISYEQKLIALYQLQQIDSQIDKIRIVRGELPLEVQDLEDDIAGLETRINNYNEEISSIEKEVSDRNNAIKESNALIKKYEQQKDNVRNNREYDSLTKEIEYQTLEIQLCEKRIKEFAANLESKKELADAASSELKELIKDLDIKKKELDEITGETEKEETDLSKRSEKHQKLIEDRLLTAYTRIRQNARNGLAVVQVERDACGGCHNKIPPQRQLDIRMHKRIIVCEYCGRILVDEEIVETSGAI